MSYGINRVAYISLNNETLCIVVDTGLYRADERERVEPEAVMSTRNESEVNKHESSQMSIHPNNEPGTDTSRIAPTNHPSEFAALVTVPQRKKRSTRQRKKLENYSLTSDEHIDYVSVLLEKKAKKTAASDKVTVKPKKQKVRSNSSTRPTSAKETATKAAKNTEVSQKRTSRLIPKVSVKRQSIARKKTQTEGSEGDSICAGCHVSYGDPCDVHSDEDWLSCHCCNSWFHQICAEDNGLLDDEYFYCKNCLA